MAHTQGRRVNNSSKLVAHFSSGKGEVKFKETIGKGFVAEEA
jgi:hypothetical protein